MASPRATTSMAERTVWRALRETLPNGWRAWHSLVLRLGNHFEGEGDFVVAAPQRGILVIEVKGGQLQLRDGHWLQNGKPLAKAPIEQARGFAQRLRDEVRRQCGEDLPFGVVAAFPDTDFSSGPHNGGYQGNVLGKRDLPHLATRLQTLFDEWVPTPRTPLRRAIPCLHELWGERWQPQVALADRAADARAHVTALVAEQLTVLQAAEDNLRMVITGAAGTGKTQLAKALCTEAAQRGLRVLYLCFTDALGFAVDRAFAASRKQGLQLRAMPIRRYAKELLDTAATGLRPSAPDFWQQASLTAACDALPPPSERPDAIVVDEMQDFDEGDWALVQELAGTNRLWMLGDFHQQFWRERAVPQSLRSQAMSLRLTQPHRTGQELAAFAACYCNEPPTSEVVQTRRSAAEHADVLQIIAVDGDERAKLTHVITALLAAGAAASDIAIVSLAGQTQTQYANLKQLCGKLVVRADQDANAAIVCDTFLRYKGLERPFVILAELPVGQTSSYAQRMHIALTRATARAIVLVPEAAARYDARLAPTT